MIDGRVLIKAGFLLAAGLATGLGFGSPSGPSNGYVVVAFAITKLRITLHEPIFVDFSIHNGLAEEIRFDLGFNRKSKFQFTIIEPDGSRRRIQRLGEEGLGLIGRISLEAHGNYRQQLLLNEWYEFTSPGTFEIEAALVDSLQTGSGAPIESNAAQRLTLRIDARNPKVLSQVCKQLAKAATESPSASSATEAALALSYVHDPFAVPYLAELLEDGPFVKPYAIQGLGRIADPRAVDILINAVKTQGPDLRSLAYYTLRQVETQVKDPELKSRIADALRP